MLAPNTDVICNILEHTSVSDAPNVIRGFVPSTDSGKVSYCTNKRLNPVVYLRKLTSHSKDLLTVMGALGVILSGSRAAEYFRPGACDHDSDWDFYCDEGIDWVIRFSSYMSRIGTWWEKLPADGESSDYGNLNVLRGMLHEGGKAHKVQLI